MTTKLILSKESGENEIRDYFNSILKLSKMNEEFPVNLDDVWPLAYNRKDHAVRDLSEKFMEGVDYQVFLKNWENPLGGRPSNEYHISVSCLEFFIARKVRAVFEVYRQVFHKSVNNTLSRKELAMMVIEAEEERERLQAENEKQQKLLEEKTRENHNMMGKLIEQAPDVKYVKSTLNAPTTYTTTQIAKELGMRSAVTLHQKLKDMKVMFSQSGSWMLTAPYCDKGYTKTRTSTGENNSGGTWSKTITVWTEKGRKFLHELLNVELKDEPVQIY